MKGKGTKRGAHSCGPSDRDTFHPADIHDCEAVTGPQLTQHAVNVVANRVFGQLQLARDFFVGQALRNETDELLFSIG